MRSSACETLQRRLAWAAFFWRIRQIRREEHIGLNEKGLIFVNVKAVSRI
jgi:hypothetical protein